MKHNKNVPKVEIGFKLSVLSLGTEGLLVELAKEPCK